MYFAIYSKKGIPVVIRNASTIELTARLFIEFSEHEPLRWPGSWKFNNSLMSETNM